MLKRKNLKEKIENKENPMFLTDSTPLHPENNKMTYSKCLKMKENVKSFLELYE